MALGRATRALHRGARRTLAAHGERVTLVLKAGGNLPDLLAHITRDVEFTEGETQTSELRNEVEMLVAEVNELKRGDKILTETGASWKVEQPLANDGFTAKAVIMEVIS